MASNNMRFRQKTLRIFALTTMVCFIIYFCSTSSVYASQTADSSKGLAVLNQVIGIDTAKYVIESTEYLQNKSAAISAPQTNIGYTLTSSSSNLKVLCSFVGGNLQMLQVLTKTGQPSMTRSIEPNTVKMAENFLTNYQDCTNNPTFETLSATLSNIANAKNETIQFQTSQLDVQVTGDYTTFKWIYKNNGVIAPSKFVGLGFSNGFLSYFVNNWDLYSIGSSKVAVSENSAKALALQAAQAHFGSNQLDKNVFDASFNESSVVWSSLIFDSSSGSSAPRSVDASVLFPVWRVGVQLDKWYGNLYGLQVDIWADTGQIRSVEDAWSSITPAEEAALLNSSSTHLTSERSVNSTAVFRVDSDLSLNAQSNGNQNAYSLMPYVYEILLTTIVTTSFTVMLASLTFNARSSLIERRIGLAISGRLIKTTFQRFRKGCQVSMGVLLLSILLISLVPAFVSVETASATTPSTAAAIWGSESIASWDTSLTPDSSWRKSNDESLRQYYVALDVEDAFSSSNYDYVVNGQGNYGSTRSNILDTLTDLQDFDRVAIVDFDHGIGDMPNPSSTSLQDPDIYGDYNTTVFSPAIAPPDEWHYHFEDENGLFVGPYGNPSLDLTNAVYDIDVYNLTGENQVVFAFINTCLSARIEIVDAAHQPIGQGLLPASYPFGPRAEGMPFAFTHKLVGANSTTQPVGYMSGDGYLYPDGGLQVYIGFPWGSASLTQKIPYDTGTYDYSAWVTTFFYAALNTFYPETVNQALDSASIQIYGTAFLHSPLRTNFNAYWWMHNSTGTSYPNSVLSVYGNGDIYIQNPPGGSYLLPAPSVTCLTSPTYTGYQINFRISPTDPYNHSVYCTINWGDGTARTKIVPIANGGYVIQGHIFNTPGQYGVTVCAVDSVGFTSNWSNPVTVNIVNPPTYYTLSTGCSSGGSVDSGGSYLSGTTAYVYAYPDPGYHLVGWSGDGTGTNPRTVYMNGDKSVYATFEQDTVYYTLSTGCSSGGSVDSGGQYEAGDTAYVYAYPDSGYHLDHWEGDGSGSNPRTVYMNGDKSVYAVFAPDVVQHWVSVVALDYFWYNELYPGVYINSQYAGSAPVASYYVEGDYSVDVDSTVWNDYIGSWAYFYYMENVGGDSWIAYYTTYKK